MDVLRKRRAKKAARKKKLQRRLAELQAEAKALTLKIKKAKKNAKKRKTEATREKAADHADSLIGERARLLAQAEDVKAELGQVNAVLRRLAHKIKLAAQKRAARKRYWASENFRFDEFDCNDGTPVPKAAYPALRHWCKTIGEPLRRKYGSVHINSGYRHRAYNAAVGGESNSVHIYDLHPNAVAGDLTCARGTPGEWYAFTAGKADGRGKYATFHHADNRNRIGWPDASWSG